MKSGHHRALLCSVFLLFAGIAFAQPGDFGTKRRWNLCPEVAKLPPKVWEEWIPVGCETVDCCPGCPGKLDRLQWRVRVEGAPLESVTLKFSRLPRDMAAALKLGGTAQGGADALRVMRGTGTIDGLPIELPGRAPVAQIVVAPAQQATSLVGQVPGGQVPEGDGQVVVEQYLGDYRVNEYKIDYHFKRCTPATEDKLVLTGNASGDEASVLLDGRRASGCKYEEQFTGSGVIGVGVMANSQGCLSEVAVFSDDDAMKFVEHVPWTNLLGDVITVNLSPDRLMAPVKIWLARPGAQATAQADIDNANLLYNSNNAGIGFAATIEDVSNNAAAVATITSTDDCESPGVVQASAFYTAGMLNVYYVDGEFTGINCAEDRNVQYIGTTANDQTLAHEFGHGMTLNHTNDEPGFAADNIMVGGGSDRTHFSDGQSFRMNTHCSSTLNVNGTRAGPLRFCDPMPPQPWSLCTGTTNQHCPPLDADVQPN